MIRGTRIREPRTAKKKRVVDAPRWDWDAYGRDVLAGRIVVGRHIRLAVERHYKDLQAGPDRGLYFCEDSAQFAIKRF